jgi:hypothetical protein
LAAACGLLDPDHWQTSKIVEEITGLINKRPVQRTVTPDQKVWREAGILSGILAQLQSYQKDQRGRTLNDALLYVSARRSGCRVLTRNISDFDFLQQLYPAARVLFYRI